ncbi:hypothetical protein [Dapis sp. BLCC M172]|uniref:hypothetical protein n=1 Tax=Dapis sp. BLCC M172 TaxID=2975281 RepID=UPI003CED1219
MFKIENKHFFEFKFYRAKGLNSIAVNLDYLISISSCYSDNPSAIYLAFDREIPFLKEEIKGCKSKLIEFWNNNVVIIYDASNCSDMLYTLLIQPRTR